MSRSFLTEKEVTAMVNEDNIDDASDPEEDDNVVTYDSDTEYHREIESDSSSRSSSPDQQHTSTSNIAVIARSGREYTAAPPRQVRSELLIDNLWGKVLGKNIYRATMSRIRFGELLSLIRFDDMQTRTERRKQDKFCPIREVFYKTDELFVKYYIPSAHLTIDEMLSLFRGRYPKTGKAPVTLVSYITRLKPTKNLLLLSTQHNDRKVDESTEKKKTDVNLYYNETKGGIDSIDQMTRHHSVKRGTRRWPLSIFFILIDIACLNGGTIFMKNNPDWNKKKHNVRRLYMLELGQQLVKPVVEERAKNIIGSQKPIISAIGSVLGKRFPVLV
ncbi:hypothetical protein ANN_09941 [Periplaneta americana]|uniref:PiggyBac transposable element-derived protein domain-containing protein n=1 Tax=Periplaneta americana TaxID=6978 RepID=A0ABQ8TQC6_PERAM|nr:hypothetical protein ANN_09941 [Periplaneta americana]